MLSLEQQGSRGPLVFMIHWLGGSSRSWTEVGEHLAQHGFRCVAVDLPGFGRSAEDARFSIPEMVAVLIDTIRVLRHDEHDEPDAPWLLAGHSMGGKLSAMLARAAEQGAPGLSNLRGVVLLSPSPPGPEPMDDSKREQTVQSLGPATSDPVKRRANAEKFVGDNIGKLPLLDVIRNRTVDDVLRMNPKGLVAWMTTGSKFDCSKHVGLLNVPALVLAGTEEKALGPDAQQKRTLPHFTHATLVPLEGSGHLSPLERPWEVGDRMVEFFTGLGLPQNTASSQLDPDFAALIDSHLTSPLTRDVLLKRMHELPGEPLALTHDDLRTLRALAARVVPNAGFDLASRLDRSLAQPRHDGWRFNTLPADVAAWKQGLASLDAAALREFAVPFIALDAARQDALLQRAQSGHLGSGLLAKFHLGGSVDSFSAVQMRDWFEDVRAELVKLYVADPRTMQRIGFTGFADEAGFTKITLSEPEEAKV